MKNQADYSKYECPYSHLEKECGHKLNGPEGYEDTFGVWCACGYRGPVFYLNPEELKLKRKTIIEEWEEIDPEEQLRTITEGGEPDISKYIIAGEMEEYFGTNDDEDVDIDPRYLFDIVKDWCKRLRKGEK